MQKKHLLGLSLALCLTATTTLAFDIDREDISFTAIELPLVAIDGLDLAAVRAEIAWGEIVLGGPELRTASSICVPKGSKNPLKDAVKVPTYYYEVPYRVGSGVLVLRDGDGRVLYSRQLEALESSERFGYDDCRYWLQETLETDYARQGMELRERMRVGAQEFFTRRGKEVVDDAIFFNVVAERIPLYTFEDKQYDYADLNEAARLAEAGYSALDGKVVGAATPGREELERAVALWEAALEDSDLNDKQARINRKVSTRIHESLGAAKLVLGDYDAAVRHLEKAIRYGLATSRSSGTGSVDLFDRAQRRKTRADRNTGLLETPESAEELMRSTEPYRGRIPIDVRPTAELARLQAEHKAFSTEVAVDAAANERREHEEAVAAGEVNPYERFVERSAMQGFFLFLMPYPKKMSDFPSEICELTHLNRLRMSNHEIKSIPEEIGSLTALEVLDLSGNQIQAVPASIGGLQSLSKLDLSRNRIVTLPDEIRQLDKLKVLELKGNPLAPGEVERLQQLLPRCKIKV